MNTPGRVDLDELLPIVRQQPGRNKADDVLAPAEPMELELPGGRRARIALAWYELIGDLQLRLVRPVGSKLVGLQMDELEALGLSADEAIAVALANLRRMHGQPKARPWHNLQRAGGESESFESSYFVDRAFWRDRLAEHPGGLVVAVPRTDALLFAPAGDGPAVDSMRHGIPGLHAQGAHYRLSSALYLFKDDRWSVLQPPVAEPSED